MEEFWRQCVRWLIDTGVLPRQHKTSFPHAQIFDLAQTLRDGVVLCNLLNALRPGSVDLSRINIRPQMLQFLCLQNLHTVIHSLENVFGINHYELFEASDLYEMTNFRQVLTVLSTLSFLPDIQQKFRPFPSDAWRKTNLQHIGEEEDIYAPLADLACERELADEEEDLYDSVPEAEDGIYGTIIDLKPSKAAPKDRRSMCINEIVETERNYVKHLNMMITKFIQPMKAFVSENDIRILFANTELLLPVHQVLLQDIESVVNNNADISQPFLKVKDNLLLYGVYCSNLAQALNYLNELVQNEAMSCRINNLQEVATPNKFKLRELLCVSMQRILKYHLLIKELTKQTNDANNDKKNLEKALEAMQEVAQYINEVKRDSETIQTINKVESCLTDYQMATPLVSYGRLLKDGELKIKLPRERKPQLRFTYLFDQALFVTVAKNESYKLTDLIRLEDFVLDEIHQTKGQKWSWSWTLKDKFGSQSYSFYAKTMADKTKWVENTRTAFDTIRPNELKGKNHSFKMVTFDEPTYCCHCKKLLLGCYYQGYICTRTKKACHKVCLLEVWKSNENDIHKLPSNMSNLAMNSPSNGRKSSKPHLVIVFHGGMKNEISHAEEILNHTVSLCFMSSFYIFQVRKDNPPPIPNSSSTLDNIYKAHRDYNGIPPPPFPGGGNIMFNVGEQVEVLEQVTGHWWIGRSLSQYDRKGYFPASHVSPFSRVPTNPTPHPSSYEPTILDTKNKKSPVCPISPRPESSNRLEDYDWFAGTLDRSKSDDLLRGKQSGTYLVRARGEHLAVSLVYHGDVKHIKIFQSQNQYYVTEVVTFRSVPELVKYYQTNLLSSSFFGLETSLMTPFKGRRGSNQATQLSPPPLAPRPQPSRPPRPTPSPNHSSGYFPPHLSLNGQIVPVLGQARVLYDFDPQSSQELGLRTGDVVNIISNPPGEGWWKGECQTRVGYFPAKFVQEIRM